MSFDQSQECALLSILDVVNDTETCFATYKPKRPNELLVNISKKLLANLSLINFNLLVKSKKRSNFAAVVVG